MKSPSGRDVRSMSILVGALFIFYAMHFQPHAGGNWDFEEFYATAGMLVRGNVTPLYGSLYPAAHILIFVPLTFLPLKIAYALWTAINLGALLWSIRLLQRELGIGGGDWPWFAALLLPGVWSVMLHGQFSVLILLLYTGAFVQFLRGHHATAGVVVGLAAIKFHLILGFMAIMLLRRSWKFLAGAALSGAAIAAVSTAMVGVHNIVAYPSRLQSVAHDPHLSRLWMMVNLRGLLFSIVGHEPSVWLVAAASAALLLYAAYSWREITVGFPCAVLVSTLTAYHAYPQELCLFIPSLMLFATRIRMSKAAALATIFSAAALAFGLSIWFLYPLYALIGVALLVLIAPHRQRHPARTSATEEVGMDSEPISR